jgi:hypothetical protein
LLVLACAIAGCGPKVNSAEAAAAAMIQRVGGRFEFDQQNAEHRIIKVFLHETKVTDADLESLGGIANLQALYLGRTAITDAGLAHLKGLRNLATLSLNNTAVSDQGLEHLSGLSRLKTLNLHETLVTAAGVAGLQQALPGVKIASAARK